jgi:hypothetical protein
VTQVKIKENSWLAKIAARNLNSAQVAMVIGKTIHLYNSTKEEFLSNERWVCHEVVHVKQYRELGCFKFVILYLLESFNKGYENNKFEVEARRKERDPAILKGIQFV